MSKLDPTHEIRIDRKVPIPMRDGTVLRADVYRLKADGRWPVIVERFPYDPSTEYVAEDGGLFAAHGYVYVLNSIRGTFDSEGEFSRYMNDGWGANRDGYDTVEWAGHQSWSDGNVGLYGTSCSASTQYLTAAIQTKPLPVPSLEPERLLF